MLSDRDYMGWAFLHAERGRGRTAPNPVVGAVIVSADGVVVGRGYHERAGEAHAEIHALDAAGPRARGATLYCTLEPCCHTGRTGPCTTRIVEAGIRRVVAAIDDPNPVVSGRGFAYLRAQGVEVDVGMGRDRALRQNAPFFSTVLRRRPLVIAKIATSIDGRIAGRGGARAPLTSEPANRRVQWSRAWVDAIGVGAGTVLGDDPVLTARGVFRERPLVRVVFDRRLRTPPCARVFTTVHHGPIVIVTTEQAARTMPEKVAALRDAGARVEAVDTAELRPMVERLVSYDVTSLLLEGGAAIHAAAWSERLVDRVEVFVTPTTLGPDGLPWMDVHVCSLAALRPLCVTALGPDVLMEADVHWSD